MQHGHRHGPWVGTLFAIGHGLLVTVIAVVVSQVGHAFHVPDSFAQVLQWTPTALLLLVAFLNLRQLISSSAQDAPASFKLRMIPPWLRQPRGAMGRRADRERCSPPCSTPRRRLQLGVNQADATRSLAARRPRCRRAPRGAHGGDAIRRLCAGGASGADRY